VNSFEKRPETFSREGNRAAEKLAEASTGLCRQILQQSGVIVLKLFSFVTDDKAL
jgi:hypothetical protein